MKSLPVIAAIVAFASAICWLLGSSRIKEPISPTPKVSVGLNAPPLVEHHHAAGNTTLVPGKRWIGQKQVEEKMAKADAANAKLDATLASRTEQQQREGVHNFMNGRKPHYDALFQSWGLSEAERQSVLDLIQSREIQHRSEMVEDAKQRVSPGIRLQKTANMKEAAFVGLEVLLGTDRAQQLNDLEQKLEDETRQQFRNRVGKINE